MLVHGCGVSIYPQFYDQIDRIFKIIPFPYVSSYIGEKGGESLK